MVADEKEWYRSRTIWGGLVALGAALAGLFGVPVDPVAGSELAARLPDLAAAVGAVLAILGRLDARSAIR